MRQQDSKDIDLREIHTDLDLEGVILTKEGSRNELSQQNAMQEYSVKLDWLDRIENKLGKKYKCLSALKERLALKGNNEIVSRLDPQSQAIINTAEKPNVTKVE